MEMNDVFKNLCKLINYDTYVAYKKNLKEEPISKEEWEAEYTKMLEYEPPEISISTEDILKALNEVISTYIPNIKYTGKIKED